MTALNLKNFNALVQEQVAAVQGRAQQVLGRLIDFSVGSVTRALVESNASLGLWLQAEVVKVLLVTRARTSRDADLDSFMADFGVYRLTSVLATGTVTFSRFTATQQAVIPIDAEMRTIDGSATFVVSLDPANAAYNVLLGGDVLAAGQPAIDVPVRATVAGAVGNVSAGTITILQTTISHVDTITNPGPMTGGGDAESDDDLRSRFVAFIKSLSRGTVDAIVFAVRNLRTGVTATIVEGAAPDDTPTSMITVTVDDGSGYPASDLLAAAATQVDAFRAAGIRWAAVAPRVTPVTVQMTLTVAAGWDRNAIIGTVGQTVRGYVDTLPLGQGLPFTRIAQIAYDVSQGITNVSQVYINSATADIAGNPRVKIVTAAVVVS